MMKRRFGVRNILAGTMAAAMVLSSCPTSVIAADDVAIEESALEEQDVLEEGPEAAEAVEDTFLEESIEYAEDAAETEANSDDAVVLIDDAEDTLDPSLLDGIDQEDAVDEIVADESADILNAAEEDDILEAAEEDDILVAAEGSDETDELIEENVYAATSDEAVEAAGQRSFFFTNFTAELKGVTVKVSASNLYVKRGSVMKARFVSAEEYSEKIEAQNYGKRVIGTKAIELTFVDANGVEFTPVGLSVSITADEMDAESYVLYRAGEKSVRRVASSDIPEFDFYTSYAETYVLAGVKADDKLRAEGKKENGNTVFALQEGAADISVKAPSGAFYGTISMEAEMVSEDVVRESLPENMDAANITAFDISFHAGSKEDVEPNKEVTVTINTPINEGSTYKLVHIDDNGNASVVENAQFTADGVTFTAKDFSVYAVVEAGDDGDYARMTVEFYNGSELVASMIVKNSDNAEQIEKILYDPGVGDVAPGELFKGWIMENPDYTDEDVTDAMTIVDIREWAEAKTITEHETVKFYAMIFNTYSVAFLNEENATLHGESLIFKAGSYADYKVDVPYTPIDPEANFEGWYWTSDTAEAVKLADGSAAPEIIKNGTNVRISGNVVFSVDAPNGRWISFVSNGNGASYTAPQFVATGSRSVKPNDPTRLGYRFTGWNTAANGSGTTWLTVTYDNAGNPSYTNNKFGAELTERVELYAQWTPVATANYSVIIWKQRVSDDKNAADADKTYDVEEVITLTGNVDSTINVVTQPNSNTNVNTGRGNSVRNYSVNGSQKAYTGFHAARYDTGVTVKAEGTSVVNVFYDRNLITIIFHPYTSRSTNGTWFYILNENTDSLSNNNVTYTGLYDAPLDFTWPTTAIRNNYSYDILWHTGSNNGDLTLSFYGSYKHYIPSNVTDTMYITGAGDIPVRFICQKVDGTWPTDTSDTDSVLTVMMSGGQFRLSEKYAGFSIKDYSTTNYTTSETGWTEARDSSGNLKSVSDFSQLNIRFTRDKYPINYLDGTYFNGNGTVLQKATESPLGHSADIYYQASTVSYNKGGADYFEPTAPDGYTFGGWFVDPTCTVPYTFTTMPDGGIVVYAKWVQTQYRVFLHPNVPSNETLIWGDSQQTGSFRVDWGKKVSNGVTIDGERPGYDLIGWYFDEECTQSFNFDAYVLNDETVTTEYDRTQNTELDKYGEVEPGMDGKNKDADPNLDGDTSDERFWINRQLNLYAKWRSVLDGAEGIYVLYDANGGSNPPKDPLTYYLDNAEATAQAASNPPEGKQFLYWVVQTWDEEQGKYVDDENSVKVYPGNTFVVLKSDARVQPITDGSQTDKIYNTYTIMVRAEYGDAEAPTPTHIDWYPDYVIGEAAHNPEHRDLNLKINQEVSIYTPNAREGYKFLGWARVTTERSESVTPEGESMPTANILTLTENDSDFYLKYVDGKYYIKDDSGNWTKEVTQVAADEYTPYHDMYAVWQTVVYVYHSGVKGGNIEEIPLEEDTVIKLTEKVTSGTLYGGYYLNNGVDITGIDEDADNVFDRYKDIPAYTGLTDTESVWSWNSPETDDGGSVIPTVGGTIYFIKEVPGEKFLRNTLRWTYLDGDKKICDLFFLTNQDDKNYKETGFDIVVTDSHEQREAEEVVASVTITAHNTGKQAIYSYTNFNKEGSSKNLIALLQDAKYDFLNKTNELTMSGYWITEDGYKVTGRMVRTINAKNGWVDGCVEASTDYVDSTIKPVS